MDVRGSRSRIVVYACTAKACLYRQKPNFSKEQGSVQIMSQPTQPTPYHINFVGQGNLNISLALVRCHKKKEVMIFPSVLAGIICT